MTQVQVQATHKFNHFLNFLQNQSQTSSIALNLCKCCAFFLALFATFQAIHIIKFTKRITPSTSNHSLVTEYDYTDDETCSLASTSSEFGDDEEEEDEQENEDENRTGEYFRIRGDDNGDDGGFLRSCRRSIGDIFSLSEIANSESVVKLWDTIGFGLEFGLDDFDSYDDGRIVSVYGADEKPSVSPAVMVTDGENASGNLLWDTRLRRRIPAVTAEWAPSIGNAVGIDGRYELTVGDMRNVRLPPLGDLTESQLDLWWPNSCMFRI